MSEIRSVPADTGIGGRGTRTGVVCVNGGDGTFTVQPSLLRQAQPCTTPGLVVIARPASGYQHCPPTCK